MHALVSRPPSGGEVTQEGCNTSHACSSPLYKYLVRVCSIQATSKEYRIPHVSWSNSQGSRLIGKTRAGKLRKKRRKKKKKGGKGRGERKGRGRPMVWIIISHWRRHRRSQRHSTVFQAGRRMLVFHQSLMKVIILKSWYCRGPNLGFFINTTGFPRRQEAVRGMPDLWHPVTGKLCSTALFCILKKLIFKCFYFFPPKNK